MSRTRKHATIQRFLPLDFGDNISKYIIISWIYSSVYSLWKNFPELAVTTHFTASCVVRGTIMQIYL